MAVDANVPRKAVDTDYIGRFREVISDPLNLLIERVPQAGTVESNDVVLHNGNRVPFSGTGAYYDKFSQLLAINRGVHEPLEEYVFQETLKSMPGSPLMIELGAYWAHYSMWLKKKRPNATVIMVEADPTNLAAGQANFARNCYQGEFIQARVARGYWELDPFLASRGISKVDIVHVDIEGYEAQLLDGGRDALGRRLVDYLFISTHTQDLHQHVINYVAGLGYRVEVASDYDNDTTSFDGFVLASSPQARQIFWNFTYIGRTNIATIPADDLVQYLLATRACSR